MNKTDFSTFPVGTVFNKCILAMTPRLRYDSIEIDYPSRLEAMALDPGAIANNNNLVYRAGQIDITVPLFKTITVGISDRDIVITDSSPRKSLIKHAAVLMQKALGVTNGFYIDVKDTTNLRHCGLGSSSSLIAGVASAINEVYSNPIEPQQLVRYLAQNHGEEIDGSTDNLVPVQCIGGSAVCGNFEGGMIVLAGEATPIGFANISSEYSVVIGIPNDYSHPDAKELMQSEVENLHNFKETGDNYGETIAYRIVHEVLPELRGGEIKAAGSLIFDYRWKMGSIKNCSFVYPKMVSIADKIQHLYTDGVCDILALSSVGPGFFAVTKNPAEIVATFQKNNLQTLITGVHNGKYVINKFQVTNGEK